MSRPPSLFAVTLQFVTLTVPLAPASGLRDRIEVALQQQGSPLRWAITAVDGDHAVIEAVVENAA